MVDEGELEAFKVLKPGKYNFNTNMNRARSNRRYELQ
jgi:hypothetical protein